MNELYSIRMTGEPSLQHWKYIKRTKLPNGKYRYYYDNSWDKKYDTGDKKTDRSGGQLTEISYKNNNELFDSRTTMKIGSRYTNITIKRGKLSRAHAKGEKFIFNNILSDRSTVKRKARAIKKYGSEFIRGVIKA